MDSRSPALFRRFPAAENTIPWMSLGNRPTPIETVRLPVNGAMRTILVKRDDRTGVVYGGNKVRKLEFLLAEAVRLGAGRIITAGAAGSHHGLATTIYGRKAGFDVSLVLFPQRLTAHVRDVVLMDAGFGAELRWIGRMGFVPAAVLQAQWRHRRDRPFVIAPGGSDALGTIGYVSAGLEIAEQIEAGEIPRPSRVHVAAGTLGTAAGLALGLHLARLEIPIAATRITSRVVTNTPLLSRLIAKTAALLERAGVDVPDSSRALQSIEIRHGHIGRGYGEPTDEGRAATRAFDAYDMRLDQTYTAKAAADLLATPADEDEPPLFMLTLSAEEPIDRARQLRATDLPRPFAAWLAESGPIGAD
ncbi:MAG: pyridoxal-phosphate dependent enzyme [Gemmatimonadetes bacterium]|nr:pyridoxal-phosphate dependent enzyme [Gemmatimonadota bacterium]